MVPDGPSLQARCSGESPWPLTSSGLALGKLEGKMAGTGWWLSDFRRHESGWGLSFGPQNLWRHWGASSHFLTDGKKKQLKPPITWKWHGFWKIVQGFNLTSDPGQTSNAKFCRWLTTCGRMLKLYVSAPTKSMHLPIAKPSPNLLHSEAKDWMMPQAWFEMMAIIFLFQSSILCQFKFLLMVVQDPWKGGDHENCMKLVIGSPSPHVPWSQHGI